MKIAINALLYFGMVFAAGFMLGVLRTLWIVPFIGSRAAELLEMPFMLIVTIFAARRILRRYDGPRTSGSYLAIGFLALVLMLTMEFGLVLRLRGITLSDYFATLDPVTGTAFYSMELLFALMPLLLWQRGR